MNAASGMLGSLLLRRLLLLVHGADKGQRKGARRVRAGGERCWRRGLAMELPWAKALGSGCFGRDRGSSALRDSGRPPWTGQILPKEGRCSDFKRARQSQGALERKESG